MTDFATPEDIANRTNAAKEAAVAAGRELGLEITEGKVLYELFSVVVHLAPSPVVARIPTVLPHTTTPESLAKRQQQELDVAQWLHDQGTPVIPPSSDVPRKPVQKDGFSITFWPFTDEDKSKEPDYVKNSELTADLHAALRTYPGELDFLSSAEPGFVREALTKLENHPDVVGPARPRPSKAGVGDPGTARQRRKRVPEGLPRHRPAAHPRRLAAREHEAGVRPEGGRPSCTFGQPVRGENQAVDRPTAGLAGREVCGAYVRPVVGTPTLAVKAGRQLAVKQKAQPVRGESPASAGREVKQPFIHQWRDTDPYYA